MLSDDVRSLVFKGAIVGGAFAAGVFAARFLRSSPPYKTLQTNVSESWFSEVNETIWPGQAMSLRIRKVIHAARSSLQNILVFDSTEWGRVLVLDDCIQCTERDECAYQETMAHTPLLLHPHPKRVMVIGGGDGGILREIGRHSEVEEIHICEIDEGVISACRQYLPSMACGFDDPRVRIHIEDGAAYMRRVAGGEEKPFDVIICDTSDPVGPAESLFSGEFYQAIHDALSANGVAATQGECFWLHQELIRGLVAHAKKAGFKDVQYASISIPTYPCGQIGCLTLVKASKVKANLPVRALPLAVAEQLKYYNTEVHMASYVLPTFAKNAIYERA